MYKYDPVNNTFTKIGDDEPISAGMSTPLQVQMYPCVYIADECIEKIADAVVRKMKGDANNDV